MMTRPHETLEIEELSQASGRMRDHGGYIFA